MRQPRSDPGSSFTQIEQAVDQHRPRPAAPLELPVFQERADRLLGALSAMKTWVLEFDDSGKMIYSSANAVNVIGFTAEEALDGNVVFHPDDLHILGDVVRKLRAEGETTKSVTRIRHKQGHWVWTEATLMAWTPSTQRNFHSLAFVRDITELKNAEAARSESEERYRLVSQMSFDLISEFDEKGEPIYVGPGVEEIMGFTREEVLDTEPFSLIHPEDEPRVRAQFDTEFRGQLSAFDATTSKYTPRLMEYRARHRDGHWISLETLGLTYRKENGQIRYLSVTRNVTEAKHAEIARRELEQSMLRAQKLESLGVLAGGIAHDFNNLLTPILGHAVLGFDELPEGSPVRTRLRRIQEAANRVASLTNQLLAYAGQQPLCVESLNLSTLIAEMHELATSSVSGKTTLDVQLDPDLPTIEGEAAQLGQVWGVPSSK